MYFFVHLLRASMDFCIRLVHSLLFLHWYCTHSFKKFSWREVKKGSIEKRKEKQSWCALCGMNLNMNIMWSWDLESFDDYLREYSLSCSPMKKYISVRMLYTLWLWCGKRKGIVLNFFIFFLPQVSWVLFFSFLYYVLVLVLTILSI